MDENIIVKSAQGFNCVSLDARLLSKRLIYIDNKEITGDLIAVVIKKIMALILEDENKTITIVLDSPGGSVKAGMALYDLLQSSKTPIKMVVIGRAYSMAAILFAAGKNGRYMLPNSEIMIHEPVLGDSISGNAAHVNSITDKLNKEKKLLNHILSKHTGKTEKQIEKEMSYDHFFTADEAVKFGICDKVIDFDKIMEDIINEW